MNKSISIILIFIMIFTGISCSDEISSDNHTKVSGIAQKGDFQEGASVLVKELDDSLNATGVEYTTMVDTNGGYQVDVGSTYFEIIITGNYFNEVMCVDRIRTLVGEGYSFIEAKQKAHEEVLAMFQIEDTTDFETLTVQADATLLCASVAVLGTDSSNAQTLIDNATTDIADGSVDDTDTRSTILTNLITVDMDAIINNVSKVYGTNPAIEDIEIVVSNVNSYIPTNGSWTESGIINPGANITTAFNKAMNFSSVENIDNYLINGSGISITGISYDSNSYIATFTISYSIEAGQTYTILPSDTITDTEGNKLNTISSPVYKAIDTTSPTNGSWTNTGIIRPGNSITTTFSEGMNQSTVENIGNYTTGVANVAITNISYDSDNYTATFTIEYTDTDGTENYTITPSASIKDSANNSLAITVSPTYVTTILCTKYFKYSPGYGLKYHVTDEYQSLECDVWAVFQEVPVSQSSEYDYLITLTKNGTTGGYYPGATLGGKLNNEILRFDSGIPVTDREYYYMNMLALPYHIGLNETLDPYHGQAPDGWITEYYIEAVGDITVSSGTYNNCLKVSYEGDRDYENSYANGTGYLILAPDVGVIKIEFTRKDSGEAYANTTIIYEHLETTNFTPHSISGTATLDGTTPAEDLYIQISTLILDSNFQTDLNGDYSLTNIYGPDIKLHLDFDYDNDGILPFYEFLVNDITGDLTGIDIDLSSL